MTHPKPTESELAILSVLWDKGQATVREVYDTLYRSEGGGYTTALKLLQLMHGKGLVVRDETQRAHTYSATISKDSTQSRILGDLVQKLFDGSAGALVMRALGAGKGPDAQELEAIRTLLNELEKRGDSDRDR